MTFKVLVDDNFHYQDESRHSEHKVRVTTAKPDDPIYSHGLVFGGRRLRRDTRVDPPGTDGPVDRNKES